MDLFDYVDGLYDEADRPEREQALNDEPFGPVKGYRARAFYWKRAGWRLRRRHRREGFT